MKNLFSNIKTVIAATIIALAAIGCSNDEATVSQPSFDSFDFDMSEIYGIWESYQMLNDDTDEWYMVDGSQSTYNIFSFSIRFNEDGSYLLDGYTSNESGTYTAIGSIITTYISNVKQAEYDIKSIDEDYMELILVRGTDAANYRLTKRW